METLEVLDKPRDADVFSEGRASAAPGEFASFTEEAAPPPLGDRRKTALLFYSVPLAGVRYYGYEGHPSSGNGTKRPKLGGAGGDQS